MAGNGTGACNDLYLSAERLKGNGAEKKYQYVDEVTVSTVQELDSLMTDAENAFYRKQGMT